jgi:hypothetical protein
MPTPRQYATNAARQAAYRARGTTTPSTTEPRSPTLMGPRRWQARLTEACAQLESIVAGMTAYAEARSDAWHESERGEQFMERCEAVEEALDLLQTVSEA